MSQERPHKSLEEQRVETFSLEGLDHPLIDAHAPEVFAAGSEHVVYTIPEHPSVVVKVDVESILTCLQALEGGESLEYYESALSRTHGEYITRVRTLLSELRSYLGEEHVPRQRYIWFRAPLTKEIRDHLGAPDSKISEVVVLGVVQKKIPERIQGEAFSVTARMSNIDPSRLGDVVDAAIRTPDNIVDCSTPAVDAVRDFLTTHPDARDVVTSFVRDVIQYSQTTQRVLDLAGEGNAVLIERDGAWTYRCIDVINPGRIPAISSLHQAYTYFLEHDSFDPEINVRRIIAALNYVAFVNTLARMLELPDRVHVFPDAIGDRGSFLSFVDQSQAAWRTLRGML